MRINGSRSITRSVRFYKQDHCGNGPQGLGTSKDSDARDYFRDMRKHMIAFTPIRDGDRQLIELAFSKNKAGDRKDWLRQFKVFRLWY